MKRKGTKKSKELETWKDNHQLYVTLPDKEKYKIYPKLSEMFDGLHQVDHTYQNDSKSQKSQTSSSSTSSDDKKSEACSQFDFDNESLRGLSLQDLEYGDTVSMNSYNARSTLTLNDTKQYCNLLKCEEHCDFQEWISWRTQANGQLVYLIQKNRGYDVSIAAWEASREALSSNTINSVIEHARASALPGTTSLVGKPYIMYGIPRAHICSKAP